MPQSFEAVVTGRFDLRCIAPRELVLDLRRLLARKSRNEQSSESEQLLCRNLAEEFTDEAAYNQDLKSLLPDRMEERLADYRTETESIDEDVPLLKEEEATPISGQNRKNITFTHARGRISARRSKQKVE